MVIRILDSNNQILVVGKHHRRNAEWESCKDDQSNSGEQLTTILDNDQRNMGFLSMCSPLEIMSW